MDTASAEFTKARELIEKARDILIVTHENPTFDSMGSTLAMYLGLTGMGKHVTVASPDQVTVEFSSFIGVNKVVTEIAKKNFIISLDYVEGSIEKVSYNIEGEKFNLVIEPRPGFAPFSKDKVHFSNSGTPADIIITVDTIHLGGLKGLYESDRELYTTQPVINIDRHANNAQYGAVNILDSQAGSTVEIVSQLLSSLGVKLTQDIATNILNALYQATSNFQSATVTGRTFELAAACVKAGGRKFPQPESRTPVRMPQVPEPQAAKPATEPVRAAVPVVNPVQKQEEKHDVKPEEKKPDAPVAPAAPPKQQEPAEKPVTHDNQAPADWLKPKVFKSSQRV